MSAEWRPVVGYEGLYEISSWGRVRSLDRVVERPSSRGARTMHQMHIRGSIRGLYQAKRGGYLAVSLWKDNKGRTRPVHALVAEAFIGPRPDGMEVRHLDGDPLNPHASNLAYGTSLENKADMRRHGTHGNAKKTHCPQGHEYTPENTHRNDKGYRWCRTCIRKRNARSAA